METAEKLEGLTAQDLHKILPIDLTRWQSSEEVIFLDIDKDQSDSGKKNPLLDDSKQANSRGTPDTTNPFISPTATMFPLTGRMTKGQMLARQMQASKPCYFNLLCIGRQNVGKSTFLERLIFKAFGKKSVIDRSEKGFVEHITERRDGNRRYILNVIDSKGYSEDYPADQWFSDIKTLIKGKVLYAHSVLSI